jgi:hypothetical protein|tara:strand:+ start:430 stop:717 length:288 start_codon:yes stop_codon:yes gene_type:complete
MELLRGQIVPTSTAYKKVSQKDKVEWALKTFKEVTGDEFTYDLRIKRYGAIIYDLRDDGWDIKTLEPKNQKDKKWAFKLISEPSNKEDGQRMLAL